MCRITEERIAEMDDSYSLDDWTVFIYRFSVNDPLKNNMIDDFLKNLSIVCDYQLFDSLEGNPKLHQPNTTVLFLVSSISDFKTLLEINYPDDVPKIITYFFTQLEYEKINNAKFRIPFKARFFYIIHPNKFTTDLIYTCHIKVFDTLYVRTVRNKFRKSVIGKDIATSTQINPNPMIAKMRELGWYLRENKLNDSDSFAGAIAIRFGKGFIINASKTDKYNIERNRVCYVENHNHEKNEIKFIGDFMPSSESLVPYLIFQEFPQINIMLHFHYKTMTYSPELDYYRTKKYVSYGTMEEAEIITTKFRETGGIVIANGHGEFFIGTDFLAIKGDINKVLKQINTRDCKLQK
ncbi:MAG: hypothetical protein V3U87_15430 [Methylococcaceae bacterium]